MYMIVLQCTAILVTVPCQNQTPKHVYLRARNVGGERLAGFQRLLVAHSTWFHASGPRWHWPPMLPPVSISVLSQHRSMNVVHV